MWLSVGECYVQFAIASWYYRHALWLVLVDALHLGYSQDMEQTAINVNLPVAILVVGVGQGGGVADARLCYRIEHWLLQQLVQP